MSITNRAASVFKEFSRFCVLNNAKFISPVASNVIKSTWTLNDVVTAKSKSVDISYFIDDNYKVLAQSHETIMDDEITFDVYSVCGQHRVTCFERKLNESNGNDSKGNILFIWYKGEFVKSINLKELDMHGLIYKKDFNFGGLQWLPSCTRLVYLAETKKPKKISHFQYQAQNKSDGNVGNQYQSKAEFGEQLEHIEQPVICVLDILQDKVELVDCLDNGYIAGRFCVHPCEDSIVLMAYKKQSYNLGLIYCLQRRSDLFYYNHVSKEIKCIASEDTSKMSPRFSLDSKHLIWLENDCHGPHFQCQRLMHYDWLSQSVSTVVDIVRHSNNGIRGIYNLGLTDNCWHNDNRHVFMSSLDNGRNVILVIDIESGAIKKLEVDIGGDVSTTLLDVNSRVLLVKVSSPALVPYLAVADIDKAVIFGMLSPQPISNIHKIDDIEYQFIEHTPTFRHPKYGANTFQSMLISPKNIVNTPLILALHGGPHSAFSNEFVLFFAAAAQLGFSSLLVNYRGSWGCGQDSIDSLLGFIGEMDVSDCIEACDDVLRQYPSKLDASNVFLYGGSHGGFLAAHLASSYSHKTRAMVCRNPVINIPSMVTSSDIPDWTYSEMGMSWNHNSLLNDEQLLKMWTRSPLRYVDNIKCPILILIGQEDKRVPPSQGKELARALLSRGVPCELHVYPKDSHPLSSNDASSDGFVNALNWFTKHLTKEL